MDKIKKGKLIQQTSYASSTSGSWISEDSKEDDSKKEDCKEVSKENKKKR